MLKLWKMLPRGTRSRFANSWYDVISRFNTGDDLVFMNHGYAPAKGDPRIVELPPEQEKHRYPIQHYHQLAAHVDWTGRDAVEISSGRGGGTAYLFDTFRPRTMTGIDLAPAAVEFCKTAYTGRDGLSFQAGDAQDLPLADACCDIVINVESSLNYPDQDAFLSEVDRILRPGGHFLIADYRGRSGMDKLIGRLEGLAYRTEVIHEIPEEICRALELDDPRKQETINRLVPAPVRGLFAAFAFTGAAAREEIDKFRSGRKRYLCAVLRKPE